MSKTCTKCQVRKSLDNFPRHKRSPGGLHNHCKDCKNAAKKAWLEDPGNKERAKEHKSQWYWENREHALAYARYRVTGVTANQYNDQFKEQGGKCAWCGTETELAADHCHDTGIFRRLLCGKCNRAEGLLKHCPEIIAAIESVAYYQWCVEDTVGTVKH